MRLFIGMKVDKIMTDELMRVQEVYREKEIQGNYTLPENYHLTLKFIGEASLDDILPMVLPFKSYGPFEIELDEVHHFSKRIIWAGIKKEPRLHQLYDALESILLKGKWVEKEVFTPHITLIRQASDFLPIKLNPLKAMVRQLTIFESVRVGDNIRYVPLYSVDL